MGGAAPTNSFSGGGGSSNYMGPTNSGSAAGAVGGGDLIPGPIGTATTSSQSYGTGWEEFCDRYARVAAVDFAKACISFINGNLTTEEARNISHRNFSRKFVDAFADHFDSEFFRRRGNLKSGNGTLDESDYNEEHESHKLFHKAFFRRLSFKGLRKGKTLFHKNSNDMDGTGKGKTKLAKIVVECRKEGYVNNLTPESIDQPTCSQKWEKCRLVLVKAVGGYMLEFYTPPKATKPRSGVFCFLISEARETTVLEMPEKENTFVLKADNNMEYVIEADSASEMLSWLATIRYCMRTTPTQQPTMDSDVIAAAMQSSPVTLNSPTGTAIAPGPLNAVQNLQYHQQNVTGSNGNIVGPNNSMSDHTLSASAATMAPLNIGHDAASSEHAINSTPDIPPRRPVGPGERGAQRLSASSNCDGDDLGGDIDINVADLTAEMREYPWFHGTLPRSEAARMVLHSEAAGHGYFLVRQSETRKGEFVLTFNFQGRAKHLRMTINEKGQCRVQHLWFPSIQDMLEHFRHNTIPLESGGTSDVMLTEWVHNQGMPYSNDMGGFNDAGGASGAGGGGVVASGTGGGDINSGGLSGVQSQQHPSPRHPQEVITMNLSVRLKTCEIEMPLTAAVLALHQQQQQQQQQHQQTSTGINAASLPHAAASSAQNQVAIISHSQQQQLRASTASLQSHQHHQLLHHHLPGTTTGIDANANAPTGAVGGIAHHHHETTPRAVDNQYSFV